METRAAFADKLARAVLLALALAVGLATISGAGIDESGAETSATATARLGGDFAAFYAAGSIVWAGDIDELYDPARQRAAQDDLGLDGYLAFAYPPHVAAAYAPLGALNFQVAYLIHTIFMALAFVVALRLLEKPVPMIATWRWPILAASFTFLPLATAVGGGQNAALSVLGMAVIWRALHDDREVVAGIAAGLLLFRPQYAIPLIGLFLLARHWRAVWAAIGTGLITWAATALVLGPVWVVDWLDEVVPFVERDAEVNASNSISILGFLQAAWSENDAVVLAGMAGAVAVVLTLSYLWLNPDRFTLANRMGAVAIGVTLISPHTMFYDASLLLIAAAAALAATSPAMVRVLAVTWGAALIHLLSGSLGATPLALVVVASFIAMVWHTINVGQPHSTAIAGVV